MDSKISAYGRRSVEIIALARKGNVAGLSRLVSPTAEFSIGTNDVGAPLGNGVDGAIAAGSRIGPSRFRFQYYVGPPPGPDDPCSPIEIEVEFSSRDGSIAIPMKFSYDHGLLQSARGWTVYESVGDTDAEAK
jgi:hypothetical protein